MLTFEQKQAIIETYDQLEKKEVSMKRVNYHFPETKIEKSVVVQHLHPNGNAFIYVGDQSPYEADNRGLTNVREATEKELRQTIEFSLALLSEDGPAPLVEIWKNADGVALTLKQEEEFWVLYFNDNVEETFGDYEEAVTYLDEERFEK